MNSFAESSTVPVFPSFSRIRSDLFCTYRERRRRPHAHRRWHSSIVITSRGQVPVLPNPSARPKWHVHCRFPAHRPNAGSAWEPPNAIMISERAQGPQDSLLLSVQFAKRLRVSIGDGRAEAPQDCVQRSVCHSGAFSGSRVPSGRSEPPREGQDHPHRD